MIIIIPIYMFLYVDGYIYGSNPSEIGGGFSICNESGRVIKQEERLRAGFTNNEAELLAVANAVILCESGGTIITDSQNTINWVNNPKGNKARRDLLDVCRLAHALMEIKQIALKWEPRESNPAGRANEELHSRRAFIQPLL